MDGFRNYEQANSYSFSHNACVRVSTKCLCHKKHHVEIVLLLRMIFKENGVCVCVNGIDMMIFSLHHVKARPILRSSNHILTIKLTNITHTHKALQRMMRQCDEKKTKYTDTENENQRTEEKTYTSASLRTTVIIIIRANRARATVHYYVYRCL